MTHADLPEVDSAREDGNQDYKFDVGDTVTNTDPLLTDQQTVVSPGNTGRVKSRGHLLGVISYGVLFNVNGQGETAIAAESQLQ